MIIIFGDFLQNFLKKNNVGIIFSAYLAVIWEKNAKFFVGNILQIITLTPEFPEGDDQWGLILRRCV